MVFCIHFSCGYSVSLYSQGGKPKRELFRGASQLSSYSASGYTAPALSHKVEILDIIGILYSTLIIIFFQQPEWHGELCMYLKI